MKNKFLAIIATLTAVAATVGIAPQANADGWLARRVASCTYDSGVNNTAGGEMQIWAYGTGRFIFKGFIDDGHGRIWDWKMYHNGDVSATGQVQGTSEMDRDMVDLSGGDTFKWVFHTTGGSIHCDTNSATV